MRISTIDAPSKQVLQVYAARTYDYKNPRFTNYVEVNVPEYVPTIPRDNAYETLGLASTFCANKNFPVNNTSIKVTHYLTLPLLRATQCPVYFPKDTPFLLFCPSGKIEEGYLLYI